MGYTVDGRREILTEQEPPKDKLKILMIAPTPFFADRGCHVRILEEYRHLTRMGHQVIVCTYHLGNNPQGVTLYRTIKIPWYKKLSAGPSYHKLYLDPFLFFLSLRKALSFRPDIIHGHLHEGTLIGAAVGRLLGIPVVGDMQGSLYEEMVNHKFIREGTLLARFWRWLEKRVNLLPDHLITSSTLTRELWLERFTLPDKMITAITDGVDTTFVRPDYDRQELRQKLNLPGDKKIVLFLGVLTEYQGIDCLLEAIELIKDKRNDLFFLIVGFPVEEYQQKANQAGLQDMVYFAGKVDYDQTPHYLCLGDFAVSPKLAKTEANLKIPNYMAAGLPVVVFDIPINHDYLGELGVYARYGDPVSLAEKIMELADDEARLRHLQKLVRERAEKVWSWDTSARKLEEIYRMITSGRAKEG